MATKAIYQFYSELDNYRPKIWRRFQVASSVTVARLGYILMTLYEMRASHLFAVEWPISDENREYLRSKYPNVGIKEVPEDFRSVFQTRRYEIPDDESLTGQ